MAAAIEVDQLVKRYGPLSAVDGISFEVPAGTVFSFLGPNGAGKTTTTEILEGLRARSSGTVRVLGFDPWSEGRALHRRIGVIPQDFRFFEKITAREGIEYYASLFGVKVDPGELLREVNLEEKADARFDTLSGGQKQKLGLALALVNNPDICFLDEPTTGLDPQARRAIWDVIRRLRAGGRTVFLTTHYLEEAELLSDHVAIINHGRIVAAGSPAEIIRTRGQAERLVFEEAPTLGGWLRRTLGIDGRADGDRLVIPLTSKNEAMKILKAVHESGEPWGRFTIERDTLEDVFVHLVGRMDNGVLKTEART